MAIITDKNYVKIIDRTMNEILKLSKCIDLEDLFELGQELNKLGVDMIELDANRLNKALMLTGINVICHIHNKKDVEKALTYNVHSFVLDEQINFDSDVISILNKTKKAIMSVINFQNYIEQINSSNNIDSLLRDIDNSCKINNISSIRLVGIRSFSNMKLLDEIIESIQRLGINLCIEADNSLCMATAIGLEAILAGADAITASFMGKEGENGLIPIEKIVVGAYLLSSNEKAHLLRDHFNGLPNLCRLFCKLTGIKIPDNEPIIGKDIFKYEAGIHADGIDKNPSTYEPFMPELIGQERSMTIGKHSGTRALGNKLSSMGIEFNLSKLPELLANVREKSVELRRELCEDEIIQLMDLVV